MPGAQQQAIPGDEAQAPVAPRQRRKAGRIPTNPLPRIAKMSTPAPQQAPGLGPGAPAQAAPEAAAEPATGALGGVVAQVKKAWAAMHATQNVLTSQVAMTQQIMEEQEQIAAMQKLVAKHQLDDLEASALQRKHRVSRKNLRQELRSRLEANGDAEDAALLERIFAD